MRTRPGPVPIVAALALVAVGGYLGYDLYRLSAAGRLGPAARSPRVAMTSRGPLRPMDSTSGRNRPRPSYYRAWLALVEDRPTEVVAAIERATQDWASTDRLEPSDRRSTRPGRQGQGGRAGPPGGVRRRPEPTAAVAEELAKIYLSSYRLTQAAESIKRWRKLDPANPRPYLWNNEIASRSDGESASILIRNYLAALERDPNLDKARLGLAEQLSKMGRFERPSRSTSPTSSGTPTTPGPGRAGPQCLPERRPRRGHQDFEPRSRSTRASPRP